MYCEWVFGPVRCVLVQAKRFGCKVLDGLNAKAALTQLVVYERLFGWAILAKTYVDYGEAASKPVVDPREIREVLPYGSLQCKVQASDEDKDVNSSRYGLPIRVCQLCSGLQAIQLLSSCRWD